MQKHTFEASNIYFFIKKEHSKHVRVLAVCNTQENIFFFVNIFFLTKPGILILNLYLHSIKTQTIIKSFLKNVREKSTIFLRNFRKKKYESKKKNLSLKNFGCHDENRIF